MEHAPTHLEELYYREGPRLLRFLRRRVADAHVADELLQQVFLVATQNPEPLLAARSASAWLYGIAANLLRAEHRRRARWPSHGLDQDWPDVRPMAGDPRLETIRAAINRLPDGQRDVLRMRLTEGLSYAETAAALQLPIGTVRSRIHLAVNRLKSELADLSATR
ncbi:MAG: sigma-70 family RNA polymerase sigma factor [Phycisphaerae bacterium]|nr:sigma-70 family RNA polymerase sigma factor [Phycisphaerae bacterium]